MTVQELFEQGIAHHRAGRTAQAVNIYRQILALDPNHAEALHMTGVASHQARRPREAVDLIRRAIAADPSKPGYHVNLGNALRATGDLPSAVASFRQAIALQPNLPDAWNNLGSALQESGDLPHAIEAHHKALSLRPDFPQAWYNLAGALAALHQADSAIEAYDRALQLLPDFDAARVNRANLLRHVGRLEESIAELHQVVQSRPTPVALSNRVYSLYFHPGYDTKQISEYLSKWNDLFARPLAPATLSFPNTRDPGRRLRIAYVSPDFNGHPAGRFFLPLVSHHDHSRFEVFCYSDASAPDAVTGQIRSHVDIWRDTRNFADDQLATQISEDRVDILVDLTLHLANNRMLVFARKPAPVQVTWLAYPGSSGLVTIDYRISDSHLDPPGLNDAFYCEKTLRLPDSYWCYDPQSPPLDVGPLPSLTTGHITFGCLNNFAKVTDVTVELWARILRNLPGSHFVSLAPEGSARARFSSKLESLGIAPARIQFVGRLPRLAYLETYRRIDVSLDTFPCNAHTTAFDSLWMGVPIVTLYGSTAMSRGGLSILSNLGMNDWVTHNPDEFVEIAVRAGSNLDQLAAIRSTLRSHLESSPLMDAPNFARSMERLYREMWMTWCTSPVQKPLSS